MFEKHSTMLGLILAVGMIILPTSTHLVAQPPASFQLGNWKHASDNVEALFVIKGSLTRETPVRSAVTPAISQDSFYVSYTLTYPAKHIDTADDGSGEFFILWLDDTEGNASSAHSNQNPNIGIHVDEKSKNRFMIRFSSSRQAFGAELQGDRETQLVAKISKSNPGPEQPFDQIELWIDPVLTARDKPGTKLQVDAARVSTIRWLGFSTGGKTEVDDRITVGNLKLAGSWEELFGIRPPVIPKAPQPLPKPVVTVSFENDVVPILQRHCFKCHQGNNDTGFRLDVADQVLNQTTPFSAKTSHLIHRLQATDDSRMPPKGERLSPKEIATISTWINEGMQWNEKLFPTPLLTSDHWAFQPIQQPDVPKHVSNDGPHSSNRTAVDAFLRQQQEALGITPNPSADGSTLLRRIHLTITGLPPSHNSLQQFHQLPAEQHQAWLNKEIVRLLNSQQYGEHWARYWLDIARWAESNGHQHNRFRPDAWRYRDYVIDSFASNKPYDQFVKEQLAGDELSTEDEHIIATGFLSAARYSGNDLDKQIQRNDILNDVTNTTATALLGLTMECAQCHTHKFDPISIRDYYRFQAFFAEGQPGSVVLEDARDQGPALITEYWNIYDKTHQRVYNELKAKGNPEPIYIAPETVSRRLSGSDKTRFSQLENEIRALPKAWAWYSTQTDYLSLPVAPHLMRWPLERERSALYQRPTYLLIRGDVKSRGPQVSPGIPSLFTQTPIGPQPRIALAEWITSRSNPLTARVWVNRIWQGHFGEGLVRSPGDFGTQGTAPDNQDLLDYLAHELIANHWNTQHIHLLILNSHAYRQTAMKTPDSYKIDPDNYSWWAWKPHRMKSEMIRDSILSTSGQLDLTRGGPSQKITGVSTRRSVYLEHRRNTPSYLNEIFDAPDANHSCVYRSQAVSPIQSLYLLNSDFTNQQATHTALQVQQAAADVEVQMEITFMRILGRKITREEQPVIARFLEQATLKDLCLVLLNSNEFIHVN